MGEVEDPCGVGRILQFDYMHGMLLGYCTIIMQNVTTRGNWVKST